MLSGDTYQGIAGVLDRKPHLREAGHFGDVLDDCSLGGQVDGRRDNALDAAQGPFDVPDAGRARSCHRSRG